MVINTTYLYPTGEDEILSIFLIFVYFCAKFKIMSWVVESIEVSIKIL